MGNNEVAKEIVVALIEQKVVNDVDSACEAYKKIVKIVYDPND